MPREPQEVQEVYVSVDIESDGPIPVIYSMLSFGAAAFVPTGEGFERVGTFEANLLEYPGSIRDKETMEWWKRFPEAWEYIRRDPLPPGAVMTRFSSWLKSLPGEVSFVAHPGSFDAMFMFWYLLYFTGENLFSHSALCAKSYAAGMLRAPSWKRFGKKNIPERFESDHPHSHMPLDDAIGQGERFMKMRAENVRKSEL